MNPQPLKAPFPAFGGKSKVAGLVWSHLGNPANFIEPFANSAATLLLRPDPGKIETINDANDYVANFWRAVKHDPEAVVEYADQPVNEIDLHARHRWLVGWGKPEPIVPHRFARHPLLRDAWLAGAGCEPDGRIAAWRELMKGDPEFYDAKIAGWWVWGSCCWIGSGWCERPESEKMPILRGYPGGGNGQGVNMAGPSLKLPDISGHANGSGRGVHQASGPAQNKPLLRGDAGAAGQGVHSSGQPRQKIPLLGGRSEAESMGRGVHAKGPSDSHRPQLADQYARGRGVHSNDAAGTCAERRAWLLDWFGRLSDRLRTVRVCCGDWLRVCDSESVTTRIGTTGIFLDAPYKTHLADGSANRSGNLYANDKSQDVNRLVDDVIAYCVERGNRPGFRIAACCYAGEGYEVLAELGWKCDEWKASGGYSNRNKAGNANAARERIWFSPHCLGTTASRHDEYATDEPFNLSA